ncbi:dyslexia-associated protein KIAA0319-like protein isoform X2 [Dreissena polymorpha]|uniref:dyslexia-associated protein KIAA0319-like protein isoform X2 n=1 Tax=Dreissena polymorpha TaxID=45954 RepID=UPI002265108F|nr:dyslexia-associated protein KIAA0319-like protein isoform X2 [Dreissena polymorpha]
MRMVAMTSFVVAMGRQLGVLIFFASSVFALSDFCGEPSKLSPSIMLERLHTTAIPRGLLDAGYFEQDQQAGDGAECVVSCCNKPLCNVAWFTVGKCFSIECNVDDERACEPVPQSTSKYKDTLFIQIRSINETKASDECDLKDDNGCYDKQECVTVGLVTRCMCVDGYHFRSSNNKTCVKDSFIGMITEKAGEPLECEYGITFCGQNKECVLPAGSKSRHGVCTCKNGFTKDMSGKCVEVANKGHNSESPLECEYGVTVCGLSKVCVLPVGSKARNGVCMCEKGFEEDSSGKCVDKGDNSKMPVTTDTGGSGLIKNLTEKTATSDGSSGDREFISTTTVKVSTGQGTTTMMPIPEIKKNTTPAVTLLTVSIGPNKVIQLPDNQVTLKAFTLPEEDKDNPYHYDWTLEAHPGGENTGNMAGKNTNTLVLTQLIAGVYTFRVQVTGTDKFGDARVNVSVLPPTRKNVPPVAVVKPSDLVVKLPNSAILDGSDSTDDDKIVKYQWEMVQGPLQDKTIAGEAAILTLTDLVPGNYTFKLTVTDSDGATNSKTANVGVIKETDYPPKANAGSDIVINLPQNSVVLSGNLSTDDKGIVSYEWIKVSSDKLAADMQGTRTSELHLSNLEVGDYMFSLKVTDSAGQVSTADVHVYVKPEQNKPPVAMTMGTMETSLPLDSILLDGSNSTDDQKIVSYAWQQTAGPTTLIIRAPDQVTTEATGEIKVGKYEFKVTVKDGEQLSSSNVLTVVVKQVANEPPIARAGGNVEVQLPQGLVTLDGSKSSDDHKITRYHWVREAASLAAGDVLNSSDHQAVLQLVNLVAGHYVFNLTVVDEGGFSSSDRASLLVKEDPHKKDLMELELEADITEFTQENEKNLEGQLALLLPKQPELGELQISIQGMSVNPQSGNLRVQFYAINVLRDVRTYRDGVATLTELKKKLMSSPYVLEYKAASVDTLVCQKNCSGHGHCDMKTKRCICEAFWTSNLFLYWIYGETNCDWSILYVVIVCFFIVIFCTGAIWGCIFCWQRKRCRCRCSGCRRTTKKRHRYSLLQDADKDEETLELKSDE